MQGTLLGSVDSQDRQDTNPQKLVTSDEGTVTSDTLSTLPHSRYGQCLTGEMHPRATAQPDLVLPRAALMNDHRRVPYKQQELIS